MEERPPPSSIWLRRAGERYGEDNAKALEGDLGEVPL